MTNETGIRIKEARTAAGLSQAALAEAAGNVSANAISKAERGLKELTPEQLEAISKILGVDFASTQDSSPTIENIEDKSATSSMEDQDFLNLFKNADDDKQKMVISILKGLMENPELTNMMMGMLKNVDQKELIESVKSIVLGSNVGDLVNMAKKLIGNINDGGMMKSLMGNPAAENSGIQNGKEFSVPLFAFTYFYSATIYILLLSFYFWLWRTDIKPEK